MEISFFDCFGLVIRTPQSRIVAVPPVYPAVYPKRERHVDRMDQ